MPPGFAGTEGPAVERTVHLPLPTNPRHSCLREAGPESSRRVCLKSEPTYGDSTWGLLDRGWT